MSIATSPLSQGKSTEAQRREDRLLHCIITAFQSYYLPFLHACRVIQSLHLSHHLATVVFLALETERTRRAKRTELPQFCHKLLSMRAAACSAAL
jgi:hypothetical protein